MITAEIKDQLTDYFSRIKEPVTIEYDSASHPKKDELVKMLEEVAGLSNYIKIVKQEEVVLRSGVTFQIKNSKNSNVTFSGIPGGHEFNSFVLALLHVGGHTLNVDQSIQSFIESIKTPLEFQTYVSLSCHNCPEIVQLLNQFSVLNPVIQNETIDGGLFPEIIEDLSIQGVPTVFLNGEPFLTGKVDPAKVIEKLRTLELERTEPKLDSSDENQHLYDVSIIGSGPAGVSAAIYAARKGLEVLLIGDRIGGQVRDTMDIENLISNIKTTGPVLSNDLESHLKEYENITLRKLVKVKNITPGQPHSLELETGEKVSTNTIIVATGAKWKELNIPGEKEYLGKGVAYCPHCDGPFFKNKDVAVIGGGNSGVEAALDLSQIVKKVTVFEYGNQLNADQVLLDKLQTLDNIEVITAAQTMEIQASHGSVQALQYKDLKTEQIKELALSGVFVQIGLVPNSEFMKGIVKMTDHDEIIVDDQCNTNVPGIFAAGDVTTTPFKQIVIAIGEGAKAALSAFNYLLLKKAA